MSDEPRNDEPRAREATPDPEPREPGVPAELADEASTRALRIEKAITRELPIEVAAPPLQPTGEPASVEPEPAAQANPDPDPKPKPDEAAAKANPDPDPDPEPAAVEAEAAEDLTPFRAAERLLLPPDEGEGEDEDDIDTRPNRELPRKPAAPRRRSTPSSRQPSPTSLFGLLRPNGAVILLGLLCALAVVESIAAFLEYRERVAREDWAVLERLLSTHEGEPVIVASEWLGPSARMHLPQARTWDSLAFPDLRGFERFWLLAHARERPWRGALRAELEGLPRPELIAVHRAGELTLHEYRQRAGVVRFSLLDSIEAVSTGRGPCSGGDGRYRCKEGRVELEVVEVDYRARRCLALELEGGAMATVDLGEQELGEQIRGHVGFGDFNDRLRADPTARVELLLDGAVVGRWVFTDDQGWAGFALATPPGRHQVELRAGTSVGGTWQRDGHRPAPTDTLCVELRGFDEADASPAQLEDRTLEDRP